MRVLVYGGRNYRDRRRVFAELDAVHKVTPIDWVIHGDAKGADKLGKAWARARGVKHLPFIPRWGDTDAPGAVVRYQASGAAYNVLAGHWRNDDMLKKGKPDKAIGFPGGSGTADMTRRLRKAGIKPFLVTE